MEAAVRELKQKAQDAAESGARVQKEREGAAEEITKLEDLSSGLKEQLQKASSTKEQVSLLSPGPSNAISYYNSQNVKKVKHAHIDI